MPWLQRPQPASCAAPASKARAGPRLSTRRWARQVSGQWLMAALTTSLPQIRLFRLVSDSTRSRLWRNPGDEWFQARMTVQNNHAVASLAHQTGLQQT